jgi:type II secretory pathway component HofQ
LRNASAVAVAATLNKLLRDVRIVADERTNSLVVSYEDANALAQIERCVAELDLEVQPSR